MRELGRMLVLLGGVLVVVGLILSFGRRLPGDFLVRRGNVTFYFPLMTSILLSIIFSLLLWLFRR
jgi:Protein of unknown function (DUF2905)